MYLQRTAHEEIASSFSLGLPIDLKYSFTGHALVSELLPLFNRIVAPDLKPVNSQVVKNEERERMMKTVNTMISTKTTFVIDKNEEGQLSYKLDPYVSTSFSSSCPFPTKLIILLDVQSYRCVRSLRR